LKNNERTISNDKPRRPRNDGWLGWWLLDYHSDLRSAPLCNVSCPHWSGFAKSKKLSWEVLTNHLGIVYTKGTNKQEKENKK